MVLQWFYSVFLVVLFGFYIGFSCFFCFANFLVILVNFGSFLIKGLCQFVGKCFFVFF